MCPDKSTWAADIWSLGCIYSEAAMWIVDGYEGLVDYRKQRMAEISRILLKDGDCFHNGKQVLQTVLDAHTYIEERLRRSDHITQLVLHSIVDEMLWEEDRPTAKALLRKTRAISSKARQRLSVTSGDEFAKPRSTQGRSQQLPCLHPPPTQPLPPVPQGPKTGCSSIAELQHLSNVEKWRSQVTIPDASSSQSNRSGGETSSASALKAPISTTETLSDIERNISGSVASWQVGEDKSVASPITPFTSSPVSARHDLSRHISNGVRPRTLQSQSSIEYERPQKLLSRGLSYASYDDMYDTVSAAPPLSEHPAFRQEAVAPSPGENAWPAGSGPSMSTVDDPKPINDGNSLTRTVNRVSSRPSSSVYASSIRADDTQIPPKSQSRIGGFKLFPSKSRNGSVLNHLRHEPVQFPENPLFHDKDHVPRTLPRFPGSSDTLPNLPEPASSMEYISMNTCLEWKKAHKKVKKHSKVPPLPGTNMLEGLKERDHVRISKSGSHLYLSTLVLGLANAICPRPSLSTMVPLCPLSGLT